MSEDAERDEARYVNRCCCVDSAELAKAERLEARVAELEAALEIERNTRIVQESNHDEGQYEDEATGPERDLADLERLAREYGWAQVLDERHGLSVVWQGGQLDYYTYPGQVTRAAALALLREKGAK